MNIYFLVSGVGVIIVGLVHSLLGEVYFLPRLRQKEQKLDFGTEKFVNRTLRSTWHMSTLASWSSGVVLLVFAFRELDSTGIIVARIISNFYLFSGVFSIFSSHARQLIWLIFFILSLLTWMGTV
ncbi:MAG: hypothetical protein DWQ10_06215 [Calditrichaeota bacterium]|nr:MAG: hypothetical protein DWQ10_06215 [Calditrichota bacterium]